MYVCMKIYSFDSDVGCDVAMTSLTNQNNHAAVVIDHA